MDLYIRRTNIEEAQEILDIQKLAFKYDLEMYKDYKTNPANQSIENLLLKINNNYYYTILVDNKIIGGAEVRNAPIDECYISRIFILPEYQNIGLGTKIMNFIENEFIHIKKWTLSTGYKSYRNHHFYEKLGYKKVRERIMSEDLVLIDYMKKMN